MVGQETLEQRIERIEKDIDDIRVAVAQNTKNISKLSVSVAALESKVDTLVGTIKHNNDIIMSFFNQYKSIVEKLITSQGEESKEKWHALNKTIDILAKVSLIGIVALAGLKFAGLL